MRPDSSHARLFNMLAVTRAAGQQWRMLAGLSNGKDQLSLKALLHLKQCLFRHQFWKRSKRWPSMQRGVAPRKQRPDTHSHDRLQLPAFGFARAETIGFARAQRIYIECYELVTCAWARAVATQHCEAFRFVSMQDARHAKFWRILRGMIAAPRGSFCLPADEVTQNHTIVNKTLNIIQI